MHKEHKHAHHSVHEIAAMGVHHARKARKAGGEAKHDEPQSPSHGYDEAEKDLRMNPEERNNAHEIFREAEAKGERKHGGRAPKARTHSHHAAMAEHHMKMAHHHKKMAKHVGKPEGEMAHHRADRMPRKAGGRTGSDQEPFTSARHGVAATGRKLEKETMD